jgi:DNA-directed RNA polymerase specialized sigma24 family protein
VRKGHVRAALARLPPAARAAVVQRYFLGLSVAEMSTALALPLSTVKWPLYAARERLRALRGQAQARRRRRGEAEAAPMRFDEKAPPLIKR